MPRKYSRITLQITDIKVERVQDIEIEDVQKEGVELCDCGVSNMSCNFQELWNNINEKRGYGWEVNPWVWVISFKESA
jgi:hypothetical protein